MVMTRKLTEETPLLSSSADSSPESPTQFQPLTLRHQPSRCSLLSSHQAILTEAIDLPAPVPTGVAHITAASAQLTKWERAFLFFSIFLVGYAYGLESQVRSAYTPYATSSFSLHSYLATINVLRSVIAVAAQPTAAKIADVFGRFEVVAVSTVLYVLGITMEATAGSVKIFCAGSILYQIGYTSIVLLMEVLVADFSSMRARVFFSYVPAIPFLINTWISGNITSAVLETTTWRWGIGMWAIVYPVATTPLLIMLYILGRRSNNRGLEPSKYEDLGQLGRDLFHQLDIVGLITLVSSFSLVLAPLTITAKEAHHWTNPSVVGPLFIGLVLAPSFVLWEKRGARIPLIPFHLLADRGVWSALAVRGLLNFAWSTQATYLYTILIVAFDFHVETATRILSFFSFFGVLSGVLIGLIIYKIRRLKWIIVTGTVIFMLAFIMLIFYPGGATATSQHGLVGAQVLLGLAGGLFAYPTQASIQASAKREHVAIITGLYLSFYNMGAALGNCLAGLIWTTTLLPTLKARLAFQPDDGLAESIYENPFKTIKGYPVGTEIRDAIITSYSDVQKGLCIAGLGICLPMIMFALMLRNPRLGEGEVQEDVDAEEEE